MPPKLSPLGLTTLRLLLGPLAWWLARTGADGRVFALILVAGLLSDIYDGVLARRLGVATEALRRYDSVTDLFYYGCILWSMWLLAREAIAPHLGFIAVLVGVELTCIVVCLLRFGKMPATHSYGAKLYGLVLFTCCFCLLVFRSVFWMVPVTVTVGLLADLEILMILFMAKTAPVDVKSVVAFRERVPEGRSQEEWLPAALDPESQFVVHLSAEGVRCERPDGTIEQVAWSDLQQVDILNTADGPFAPDLSWLLHGSSGGCVIPWGATGDRELLERLQALPGFDNAAVMNSGGTTMEKITRCWQRGD